MLSVNFEKLGSILINEYEGCKVKEAIVFAGDDWQEIKRSFDAFVKARLSAKPPADTLLVNEESPLNP